MTRALVLIGALVLALATLTSCTLGPQRGDDVLMGGDPGEVCAPVHVGGVFVFGDTVALAQGASRKTLISAEIVGAAGIELVEASIVPDPVMSMSLDDPVPGWDQRVDVEGTVLHDEPVNVVVMVRRTGTGQATAEGIRVLYEGDGTTHFAEGTTAIVLQDSCG